MENLSGFCKHIAVIRDLSGIETEVPATIKVCARELVDGLSQHETQIDGAFIVLPEPRR